MVLKEDKPSKVKSEEWRVKSGDIYDLRFTIYDLSGKWKVKR